VPGAYSEQAVLASHPGAEPLPCPTFGKAFRAVSEGRAERAVLPIENSLGGSIHATYDLLLGYPLHVVGEGAIPVRHCLLALPGTALGDLERALSHPQALAQTADFIRGLPGKGGLGVAMEAVDDTAGAAQAVADERLEGAAAVASSRAAELYGLDVLAEDIQDNKLNFTRFIHLAREPHPPTPDGGAPGGAGAGGGAERLKTSVVFGLREGPGELFKALSAFALREIDLTKIESRPLGGGGQGGGEGGPGALAAGGQDTLLSPQGGFTVLFYVDFEGSLSDKNVQNALRHLQEISTFLRVLGSYPFDAGLGQ